MKSKNYTKKEFERLKRMQLFSGVSNQEANIFIDKVNNEQRVVKEFRDKLGTYFVNKIYTLNLLNDLKRKINIEELTFPNKLVKVSESLVGYEMNYVEGVTLQEFISKKDIDIKLKIFALKKFGDILSKIKEVRKTVVPNFYLNDIHEGNIIVNLKNNELNISIIDLDSCKILDNDPLYAKYLIYNCNPLLLAPHKYEIIPNSYIPIVAPNKESELYCYTQMILNLLYGTFEFHKLTLEEQYEYFDYLNSIGLSKELIVIFQNLYTNKPNYNPKEYLENIENLIPLSNYNAYKKI